MPAHNRSTRGSLALFGAILSLLIAAVPVGATGGSGYAYRADIAPDSAAAGRSSSLVVTVKQLSGSSDKKVRSVRVSAPDGITITGATAQKGSSPLSGVTPANGSVTVNNIPSLNSGQALTITIQAFIPCGQDGPATWAVIGRNGTTFATGGSALSQDPDSDLTIGLTKCSLAWVTGAQPASAQRLEIISSQTANPGGPDIKVQLRDGNGQPASQSGVMITLAIKSGTGASGADLGPKKSDTTNGDGVAAFEPTINKSGRDYQLRASASDPDIIDSDPSGTFDIEDVAKLCDGPCSGSSDQGSTTATINASSNGGVLTMSLGLDQLDCNDAANHFYESISSPLTWDITPANGRTEITIRLDASDVTRSYNLYDVCFSSPVSSFRNRYNVRIAAGEAGLLKICPPRLDKQDADPCVVDKWREDGDVLIKFSVPKGDPRGRI